MWYCDVKKSDVGDAASLNNDFTVSLVIPTKVRNMMSQAWISHLHICIHTSCTSHKWAQMKYEQRVSVPKWCHVQGEMFTFGYFSCKVLFDGLSKLIVCRLKYTMWFESMHSLHKLLRVADFYGKNCCCLLYLQQTLNIPDAYEDERFDQSVRHVYYFVVIVMESNWHSSAYCSLVFYLITTWSCLFTRVT